MHGVRCYVVGICGLMEGWSFCVVNICIAFLFANNSRISVRHVWVLSSLSYFSYTPE